MPTSGPTSAALARVFRRPGYVGLAAAATFVAFTAATWFPNLALARADILGGSLPLGDRASLAASLWASIGTNFSGLEAALVIAGVILFGVTLAMATFVLRRRFARFRSLGVGVLGLVAGAFGLGCAACGSALILSAALPFLGLASFIPHLPLHGAEIGLLGVLLQLVAVRLLAKDVLAPAVCAS